MMDIPYYISFLLFESIFYTHFRSISLPKKIFLICIAMCHCIFDKFSPTFFR